MSIENKGVCSIQFLCGDFDHSKPMEMNVYQCIRSKKKKKNTILNNEAFW